MRTSSDMARRMARRTWVGFLTGLLAATGTVAAAPAGAEGEAYDRCMQIWRPHADVNGDNVGDLIYVAITRERLRQLSGNFTGGISGGGNELGRGFAVATRIGLGDVIDGSLSEVVWTDTSGVMRIESYWPRVYGAQISSYEHRRTIVVGRGWSPVREWTVGDVTADGYADIVGLRGSELWLWEGWGSGRFRPGRLVGGGWSQADRLMVEPLQLTPQEAGCTTSPVIDGHLLATFRDGRMASYQVRGDGKFAPAQPVGHGWASFQHVALSDVDIHRGPQGRLDLVAQDAAGAWWSYEGLAPLDDGTPRFGPARDISGPWYTARIVAP